MNARATKQDEHYMKKALILAEKGRSIVSPNPVVGAVVVKNGKVLSQGYHHYFGGPHAEVEALKGSEEKYKGATLYVTLEPCCHEDKKTPPCVPLIIKKGIARVVVAHQDANPKVSGRGIQLLKKAGITVDVGCMEKEAHFQNEFFFYSQHHKKPYVSLKIASTLDGRIAAESGDARWVTGEQSRAFVKKLRDRFDAILVGKNTALLDNPHLAGERSEPWRVILDHSLEVRPTADVFRDSHAIVIASTHASSKKIQALQKKNVTVIILKKNSTMKDIVAQLYKKGINSVLVEGGGQIFGSFIKEKAFNDLYWFTAPKIIGDSGRASIASVRIAKMAQALSLEPITLEKYGNDILQHFRLPRSS
ncbi:bifunctional diaminohydroxyphosphoribosylaminopyrimidine deaminase/5-amino-6-(5-phosphoribosylamino)uracil reductase RibD [Candidatus Gracilibacteria bacterium]|nr:bifunctional diaminohydroxyphosphoribosylaminopyrimidine deaminase/5-amino-6-(5-phosphoribosylamino)uracil reductase RibD [Candidatus Gracilibacteria bacterium]